MTDWSWSYRERVSPNLGILSLEEQEMLRGACIGIAGCGAIGGHAASELAYWGVGSLKLADFDVFETSNANRQLFAAFSTVGKEKVKVVAENIRDISPEIHIDIYDEGVTLENVDAFAQGCDMILDAIDYEAPKNSIALHRIARMFRIPVFVAQCVGFGASMFAFYPDDISYEQFLGLDPMADIDGIQVKDIDLLRLCPIIPDYINRELLESVMKGEIEAPTVIAGQTIAVSLTVTEMVIQLIRPSTRKPIKMAALDIFKGKYLQSDELLVQHGSPTECQGRMV